MKTPIFLPGDQAPLIVLYDAFCRISPLLDNGLDDMWFDYEFIFAGSLGSAQSSIFDKSRRPDLLIVAEDSWDSGGSELVRQIRDQPGMRHLPVYSVKLCSSLRAPDVEQCFEVTAPEGDCSDFYFGGSRAAALLHPSGLNEHIDGVICAASLRLRLPEIVERMASHWLEAEAS